MMLTNERLTEIAGMGNYDKHTKSTTIIKELLTEVYACRHNIKKAEAVTKTQSIDILTAQNENMELEAKLQAIGGLQRYTGEPFGYTGNKVHYTKAENGRLILWKDVKALLEKSE